MYKVWYRNGELLEVDVFADNKAALRHAAAITTGGTLRFVGIEGEMGTMLGLVDFDDYVRGFQARGLDEEQTTCPKYYVDVSPPEAVCRTATDEWVRYAIEQTKVRADNKAREAETIFGAGRVRVVPVTARTARV